MPPTDVASRDCKMRIIHQTLQQLGYNKVFKDIYRGSWSSMEIEHFIVPVFHGKPGKLMGVDFGLKNSNAENFSIEVLKSIVGGVYSIFNPNEKFGFTMRFSVGNAANWKPAGSLMIDDLDCGQIHSTLLDDITKHVLQSIKTATNFEDFMGVLVRDEYNMPWIATNGAIRAAQVVWIAAHEFGFSYEQVCFLVMERERHIASALYKSNVTVEDFLSKVFSAALSV